MVRGKVSDMIPNPIVASATPSTVFLGRAALSKTDDATGTMTTDSPVMNAAFPAGTVINPTVCVA